jgi:hypothetical protein
MELHFISAALGELDSLESEVLACSLWQDVRPMGGVAGLCDWRLAGRISSLLRGGFLRGSRGEVMMIPGRPRMSFDKILLFGAGPRGDFDEERYREIMRHMMRTIEDLCSRLAVVELPGRQDDLIPAERAADMLLEEATLPAAQARHDVWTLIEGSEARRRIETHMIEERRRIREPL